MEVANRVGLTVKLLCLQPRLAVIARPVHSLGLPSCSNKRYQMQTICASADQYAHLS